VPMPPVGPGGAGAGGRVALGLAPTCAPLLPDAYLVGLLIVIAGAAGEVAGKARAQLADGVDESVAGRSSRKYAVTDATSSRQYTSPTCSCIPEKRGTLV
jgi:hypothetical protein